MWKTAKGAYRLALRSMENGEVGAAAELLAQAVEKFPDDWTLWQLLGNARDDLDDEEGALAAYERALRCPEVWEAPVLQNRAVVLERLDRHAEALSDAERALADEDREPFEAEAVNVAVTCLLELGRGDGAVELVRAMIDRCGTGCAKARLGALHAELAWALWLGHDDRDAALAELRAASKLDPHNPRIHELLAEVGGERPSWLPPTR